MPQERDYPADIRKAGLPDYLEPQNWAEPEVQKPKKFARGTKL